MLSCPRWESHVSFLLWKSSVPFSIKRETRNVNIPMLVCANFTRVIQSRTESSAGCCFLLSFLSNKPPNSVYSRLKIVLELTLPSNSIPTGTIKFHPPHPHLPPSHQFLQRLWYLSLVSLVWETTLPVHILQPTTHFGIITELVIGIKPRNYTW